MHRSTPEPETAEAPKASPPGGSAGRFDPRPFRPSPWLPGPHGQTLGGKLLRPDHAPPVRRERLETPDGDFLDVDLGPEPASGAPVVVVLHGLEGSSRRRYVLSAYRALLDRGVRPVGMNFRGCSGEMNRRARFYHSGETGDLRFVVETLRSRFPDRPVGALGFSLGGNVLLKLLGEEGRRGGELVDAGAAISVPFDLAAGSRLLEESLMGRLYTHYFLRMLRSKVRRKRADLEGRVDVDEALRTRTLRAFDDVVTAPLHGFRNASEYYDRSSSARFLADVRAPTLLLQSRDDPFLPRRALPLEAMGENPDLHPVLTDRGGHVGFVEGPPWSPGFWAEEEAARFLAAVLEAPGASDEPGGG